MNESSDSSDSQGFHCLPSRQGLYDPQFEKDACGVGFIAHIDGKASHDIVRQGLEILCNLKHRGACGSDPDTGDGAGILIQIPDAFFRRQSCEGLLLEHQRKQHDHLFTRSDASFELPPAGQYGVGMVFLPALAKEQFRCEAVLNAHIRAEGLEILGWRDVPTNGSIPGAQASATKPCIRQVFVSASHLNQEELERKLYIVRQMASKEILRISLQQSDYFYIASFSTRTICYKGLLLPEQMAPFYRDLAEEDVVSALALVHQRFSTNTFPSWRLAHPFRYLAHNGEINTLRGNVHWMHASEYLLRSSVFGQDIHKIKPLIDESGSDSSMLDNMVEALVLGGRSLPHALMMLVPEAYEGKADIDPDLYGFYRYHATLMEPWDGPAALSFTDGKCIGAVLDRNGLRPARYVITNDNHIVLASEAGVLRFPPEQIVRRGRVEPGSMIVVDTERGVIMENNEIKQGIAQSQPYGTWAEEILHIDNLAEPTVQTHQDYASTYLFGRDELLQQQQSFGYSDEDISMIIMPMAHNAEEPVGSMGTDTPLAVLSEKPQLFFHYFKQLFAQVTNPPIDPLRETLVMSLRVMTGRRDNIFDDEHQHCRMLLELDSPILTTEQLEKIRLMEVDTGSGTFRATTVSTLYDVQQGVQALEQAIIRICRQAEAAVDEGYSIVILSDRGVQARKTAIPSLLIVSAVHHHLITVGKRTLCGLVLESGEPREVMHYALLLGYGASAINPYLSFATIDDHVRHEYAQNHDAAPENLLPCDNAVLVAQKNYIKALEKGLLKIFSKMGISTLASYHGAQMFEAIGLSSHLVDKYLPRTISRLGGIDLKHIHHDVQEFHRRAFPSQNSAVQPTLARSGDYRWLRDGETHAYNPASIHHLQHATRNNDYAAFKEYSEIVNARAGHHHNLRSLFELKSTTSLPIHETEPVEAIMKRFVTGAMSFGSLSKEAHEALAIAMNTIGGRSNTGEGGEDPERFFDNRRSAIKQIASGRFGVTSAYLVHADELQIKIAQGAKPGEGGQLPGYKVDEVIARVRHSIPGVTLISPPPHHDIYSIEDLAQLIFDLKNANPRAAISVKLVSEAGVGVVAAGVSKAHADTIIISGYDGGTGASPLSSIRHAGLPWELGLAEAQQVLVLNNLRGRTKLQVDGQLKTGRDVIIAALLGAEEFGFATAPLVVAGCVLMRKCHTNACPVGIATQNPALRQQFTGKPEHIMTFFRFIAEEVREIMADLGVRHLDELIGQTQYLKRSPELSGKAATLDLESLLYQPYQNDGKKAVHYFPPIHTERERFLDDDLLEDCKPAFDSNILRRQRVKLSYPITNNVRSVGTMLGSEVSRRFGEAGLPDDSINLTFTGTAGQSFGAFIPRGLSLNLVGEANDYVGKGLSGGKIFLRPEVLHGYIPEHNVIAGNTCLYGATSGELYCNGIAGERFAVRNSGALAVVEGVGDHGCEYMTGGVVVVLGPTGRNFAAGMSGGLGYVYDPERRFAARCNHEMVDILNVEHCELELQEQLRWILERHRQYTQSPLAGRLLEYWSESIHDFALVLPHEYRRFVHQYLYHFSESEHEFA